MNKRLFLISLFILLYSCKKFVEVEDPIDKITSDKIFTDDKTATSALVGIYSRMGSVGLRAPIISTGATTIYTGLYADELTYTGTVVNQTEFASNSISIENSIIASDIWRYGYNFIYHTNAVIDGIEKSTQLTPDIAKQLLGEAKFIRAYLYFYLVNLFGDIPLITKTDYQESSVTGRTPIAEIFQQIIQDLKNSKSLLNSTNPGVQRVRPNKWAASALLARAYLYKGDWTLAEAEASEVINSGSYSLLTNLNNVFLNSSNEIIWQLIPFATSLATIEGFLFIPTTSATTLPAYPLTMSILGSFEPGDLRRTNWINNKIVGSQTYYYPYKYKVKSVASGAPITEYHILLRYAEMFLIRAEARAKQNNLPGTIADVNVIRQRAGLSLLSASLGQSQLLTAIAKERKLELFAECGHRWFDLKRTNEANTVLGTLKPGWQIADTLFPIPQSQILANPNLSQNPGY